LFIECVSIGPLSAKPSVEDASEGYSDADAVAAVLVDAVERDRACEVL
jgi:hypothetical protein